MRAAACRFLVSGSVFGLFGLTRKAIELAAVLETHGDVLRAGELHDFFDASVLAALGDEDAVESAAGFEGFADGVNAGETIHGKRVYS